MQKLRLQNWSRQLLHLREQNYARNWVSISDGRNALEIFHFIAPTNCTSVVLQFCQTKVFMRIILHNPITFDTLMSPLLFSWKPVRSNSGRWRKLDFRLFVRIFFALNWNCCFLMKSLSILCSRVRAHKMEEVHRNNKSKLQWEASWKTHLKSSSWSTWDSLPWGV